MPKIIVTLTKANSDPWIVSSKDLLTNFIEEERLQKLKPYMDYVLALPGYSYEQSLAETYIDGDTSVTAICFDTEANMLSAKELLFGSNLDPVIQTRNSFIRDKMQSANITYVRVITTQ